MSYCVVCDDSWIAYDDTTSLECPTCNQGLPRVSKEENSSGLFAALKRHGDARCTDPRDKIYGLLSLLPLDDIARVGVVIDYGKPLLLVYREILSFLFYTTKRFRTGPDILNMLEPWFSPQISDDQAREFLVSRTPLQIQRAPLTILAELPIMAGIYLSDLDHADYDPSFAPSPQLQCREGVYFGRLKPGSFCKRKTRTVEEQTLEERTAVIMGHKLAT